MIHSSILSMNRLVPRPSTKNFQTAVISASFCTQIKFAICSVAEPEDGIFIPVNLLIFDRREQESKKCSKVSKSLQHRRHSVSVENPCETPLNYSVWKQVLLKINWKKTLDFERDLLHSSKKVRSLVKMCLYRGQYVEFKMRALSFSPRTVSKPSSTPSRLFLSSSPLFSCSHARVSVALKKKLFNCDAQL